MLNTEDRLRDFPSLAGMTYLNTAAEGIPPLVVGAALTQYFHDHQLGMDGRDRHHPQLAAAKALTAELFGLTADEVAICSCSSEAYNLLALALRLQPGDEVIINDLDFPAGATPWLQPSNPATTKIWASRNGALHVEDLIPLLSPRTRLITSSLVSFYNGYMIPLPAVVEAVRQHSNALFALDVTQALGRIPLDLSGVDVVISSTHKWILASHGGGLVGIRSERAAELTSPAGGWFNLKTQVPLGPGRLDPVESLPGAASFAVGMPNFPAIYAIRAALEYITNIGVAAIDQAAAPLVRRCLDGLQQLPIELLTPPDPANIAGILAFKHPAMERIHQRLREANIHVMSHAGRLRIAIHGYNTQADIDHLLTTLEQVLHDVQ
jgi:cysteine desulfurase/selenocysteine lyase